MSTNHTLTTGDNVKTFIFGFLLGSLLSGGVVFAALPGSRMDREFQKFIEDSDGNVAIRAVLVTE